MNRIAFGIWLLVANGACLAGSTPGADTATLRQEVLDWMRTFEDFRFTGTVEFEKIIRTAADPSRLDQLAVWSEDSMPVFKVPPGAVLAPEDLERMGDNNRRVRERYAFERRVATEWAVNGLEITQAWRIDVFGPDRVRVEYSQRYLRPPDRRPEPAVHVAVRNGEQAWVWYGPGGPVYHHRSPGGASSLVDVVEPEIDQALAEVERVFDREWLLERTLVSVEQRGGMIVAKLAGNPDAGPPTWTWRLEFRQAPQGLLLTRRVTIARDTDRYFVETFSDHRPVAGGMVAYHRTIRQGPIEEFDHADSPANSVRTYRFRTIRQGLTPADFRRLGMPEGALARHADTKTYIYGDVTGPGRLPFKPAQTLASPIPGPADQ